MNYIFFVSNVLELYIFLYKNVFIYYRVT